MKTESREAEMLVEDDDDEAEQQPPLWKCDVVFSLNWWMPKAFQFLLKGNPPRLPSNASLFYSNLGNCKVEILKSGVSYESSPSNILFWVSDSAKIKISVKGKRDYPNEGRSFLLLNPKDIDSRSRALLQDVLKLYMKELPTMNYAANTGKESSFLERCVSSGKYRTLVMKANDGKGSTEFPQRLYTLDELKLNGTDILSLLSLVDLTLGQIERNLQFAAVFGGLSAWVGFGLNLLQILLVSLGILSLWKVNQVNLSFPS